MSEARIKFKAPVSYAFPSIISRHDRSAGTGPTKKKIALLKPKPHERPFAGRTRQKTWHRCCGLKFGVSFVSRDAGRARDWLRRKGA
jgi:hypothetical protein